MNIQLLKKLDAVIGHFVVTLFSPPVCSELASPVTSLLLIRPGGIGDAVLLSPLIRSLKKTYPAIHITVLAEERNAGVFSLIPGVGNLLRYDRPADLIKALRSSYDVVIDSEQWHRLSAVVARIVSASAKIGFETNERRRMFSHPIPYSQADYEAVSFGHLLEPLGIEVDARGTATQFLFPPATALAKAEALLGSLNEQPFVVIFPGASIPERRWGADRFQRVAELLSSFDIRMVVVGGKEDQRQGEMIIDDGLGLNLAGVTSLAETAAVIQKSSLLLSGDSGVLHVAVGLGVPTVSLFGPGRAKKWAPQGAHHIVINTGLSCSPCTTFGTTPPCPIDARCMRDIGVDEVLTAVTRLLTIRGAMPRNTCKRDSIEPA